MGLVVIESTPEDHDKQIAVSLALTHFIGRALSEFGAGPLEIDTEGYSRLLQWRNELVHKYPGLYVCGFGWEGIGLNDMIKSACLVGDTILSKEVQTQEQAEPKKIYF